MATDIIFVLIVTELLVIAFCMLPAEIQVFKFWHRFMFCLGSAGVLMFAQLKLSTTSSLTVPTSEIIKTYTRPLKRLWRENKWGSFQAPDTNFLTENFIFIDVSDDIVPTSPGNGRQFKVDRNKLAAVYKQIYSKKDRFQFVASDVFVQDIWNSNNTKDADLRQIIDRLGADRKILQAVTETVEGMPNLKNTGIPIGMVDSDMSDGFIYKSELIADNQIPNFAYEMYQMTDSIRNRKKNGWSKDFGEFSMKLDFPKLEVEKKAFTPQFFFIEPEDLNPKNLQTTNLGMMCIDTMLLSMQLDRFRHSKVKPIIFVGSFSGKWDLHRTSYGDLQGGFILANIYYNLHLNLHQLPVSYLIFVFISFALIFNFGLLSAAKAYSTEDISIIYKLGLIRNIKKKFSNASDALHRKVRKESLWGPAYFILILYSIFLVFRDNLQYACLVLVVSVADFYFNQSLNVLGLTFFVFLTTELLRQLFIFHSKHKINTVKNQAEDLSFRTTINQA